MNACAVLVLYERSLEQSSTFRSIAPQLLKHNIPLLIYDNSNFPHVSDIPTWVSYVHDPANGGLSCAYNHALNAFKGCDWLITLDQDTCLPENFLDGLRTALSSVTPATAAVVPNVFSGGKLVSPCIPSGFKARLLSKWVGQGPRFINSGACLNAQFLRRIGGYPEHLRLDFLDVWLSDKIFSRKMDLVRLPVALDHELSLSCIADISNQRLEAIFQAEYDYYRHKRSITASTMYKVRLLLRLARSIPRHRDVGSRYLKLLGRYILKT